MSSNAAVAFGLRLASTSLSFLVTVVAARSLGPAVQGTYSTALFVWMTAVGVFGVGVQWTNAAFAGRQGYGPSKLLFNSAIFVVVSAAISLVTYVLLELFGLTRAGTLGQAVAFLVPWIPLAVGSTALTGILLGENRVRAWSVITYGLGPLGTLIWLLLSAANHWGLTGALIAWILGYALAGAASFGFLARQVSRTLGIDIHIAQESLWFGARSMVAHLMGTLNLQFDIFLVFILLGPRGAGPYAVVEFLANGLFFVPIAISSAILPVLSRVDRASAVEIINKSLRISVAAAAFGGIALVLGGRFVLPLYGDAYISAWPALLALVPGVAFSSLAHITTVYWEAHVRMPHINLYMVAVSLLLSTALDLWLVPRIGILGAGLGATIGYSAMTIATLTLYWRRNRILPQQSLLPRLSEIQALIASLRAQLSPTT